jgi:hypothetical protein
MTDGPPDIEPAEKKGPGQETAKAAFGVERETAVPRERLREIDLLRTGTSDQIRAYLERHLHSDRFYIDGNRIWLELPNQRDAFPDMAASTWFVVPVSYALVQQGPESVRHAVPVDGHATLCQIPLTAGADGFEASPGTATVSCRWCEIRLTAIELATGTRPDKIDPNRYLAHRPPAPGTPQQWDEESFLAEAERLLGERDAAVASRLIEWAKTTFGGIEWGSASKGRFTPTMRYGGQSYGPVHVWTTGSVAFQFSRMSHWPPFDDEVLRLEFLHRLNQIPAVDLPQNGINGKPRTTLSAFRDPSNLATLCRELEGWAAQIRSVREASTKLIPRAPATKEARRSQIYDVIEIPEFVREGIRAGLTPHQLWRDNQKSRAVYLAAIIEEARAQGELAAFEPTPANVEMLRDKHEHRWERIAARIFGDPRRRRDAMDLYDEAKGRAGAAQESYTGRGRRFPKMN